MAFRYFGTGWRVAHSLRTFGDQIMDLRGHKVSYLIDGTLGNLEHSNRTSDHNPDHLGIVRALDFFEHKPGFVDEIFEAMRVARDERLKYAIHDGQMFASYTLPGKPAWEWREYFGPNPHRDHGHLSVVGTSVADQDHEWELAQLEEDVMTPAQEAKLDQLIATVGLIPREVWSTLITTGEYQRSTLQALFRTEQSNQRIELAVGALDLEGISEAELDERIAQLAAQINTLPAATIAKLKEAL